MNLSHKVRASGYLEVMVKSRCQQFHGTETYPIKSDQTETSLQLPPHAISELQTRSAYESGNRRYRLVLTSNHKTQRSISYASCARTSKCMPISYKISAFSENRLWLQTLSRIVDTEIDVS